MRARRHSRPPHCRPHPYHGRLGIDPLDERTLPSGGVNQAPIAVPDQYTINGLPSTTAAPGPGVLANDFDPDGDALTAVLDSGPAHGTVTLRPDGTFVYVPAAGYVGPDSFTYHASDGSLNSNAVTVSITVGAAAKPGVTITGDSFIVAADNTLYRVNSLTGAVIATYPTSLANDGVAVAPNGNIYVADYANDRIRYYDPSRNLIDDFSTDGLTPQGLAFGPDGNLYVTTTAGTVERFAPDGSDHTTFIAAGSGGLNNAKGIVWGPDGNAYVSSYFNSEVLRYNGTTGAFLNVFATGSGGFEDLTFGPDGDLYVASYGDGTVYRFRGTDGTALGAFATNITTPYGLRFDPDGNLQVSSRSAGRIQTFDGSTGAFLGTLDSGLPNPAYIASTSSLVTTSAGGTATFWVVLNSPPAGDVTVTPTNSAPGQGSLSRTSLTFTSADWNAPQAVTVTGLDDGVANGDQTYQISVTAASSDENYDGIPIPSVTVLNREVAPPNSPPMASPDGYTTDENRSLSVPAGSGLLANDIDADGDPLTVSSFTQPARGMVTVNSDGSFTYSPATDYFGTDSFTYTISDGRGGTATGTATVTVTHVNQPPTAVDDRYTMGGVLSSLTVAAPGVLANDTDPDDDPLTVASYTQPANGTLTLNPDGSFTYTPNPLFLTGTATFTYSVTDGQLTSSATVTIDVQLTGNRAPTATGESYSTPEDTPLTVPAPGVLGNDSDPDGDTLAAVLDSDAARGHVALRSDGSFTYTPDAGYVGPDSFTYHATDGSLNSNVVTVSLGVTTVNHPPTAAADSYSTGQNTPLTVSSPGVLVNDTDPDGDPLTVTLLSGPLGGALSFNVDGSFTYTPDPGFRGTDSFTYQAADPSGATSTATVSIRVIPPNGNPVAADDSYTTGEDAELDVPAPGVLANDTPPGNLPLTAQLVSGPSNGTLTFRPDGSFTYVPNDDFVGTDAFVYKTVDANAGASGAAHVTIIVTATEDPPVAQPDAFATDAGVPLRVAAAGVLANDTVADGDPLTAVLVTGPAHGSLALGSDGSFVYTPAAGFSGVDTFTYEATVESQTSTAVAVTITVRPAASPTPTPVSTPVVDPTPEPKSDTGTPTPPAIPPSSEPTTTPTPAPTSTGGATPTTSPTGSPAPTVLPPPVVVSPTVLAFGVGMPAGGFLGPGPAQGRAVETGPAPTVMPSPPPPGPSPIPAAPPPLRSDTPAAVPVPPVVDPPVVSVVPPVPVLGTDNPVFTGLDDLKGEVTRPKRVQVAAGTAVGTGMALTAGTVLFSPRLAYWFLSALLARRTVWKPFDPLEVMYAWDREHGPDGPDADDDSLERMVG